MLRKLAIMEYAQPQKGKNTLLWVIVGIAGTCILLCAGGGFWGVNAFRGLMGQAFSMVGCSVDIQAARGALKKYAAEHDGKLPSASQWQDAAKPYFLAERGKIDESDAEGAQQVGVDFKLSEVNGVWGCHLPNGKIQAFVFNQDLSGKKLADIKDADTTVLLFEGTESGRNLSGKYTVLKPTADMRIGPERRAYLKITVDGEFKMQSRRGRTIKVETGTSSE